MYDLLQNSEHYSEMNQISDEAIIEGIKLKSQYVVSHLYEELFPGIVQFVQANSGTEDDAQDIFQEALIVIYQKTSLSDFEFTSSFKNYFFGICRMLWLKKISKGNFEDSMEVTDLRGIKELLFEEDMSEGLQVESQELMMGLYQKHFLSLSDECRKILKLHFQKIPFSEIAEMMGLVNEKYAKTRKYMCKEKLKQKIKEDPQYKNYFEYEK